MINGIIKLFYSEIVKTKIKSMPSSDYTYREECREIRNMTLKLDSVFLKITKLLLAIIILYISFNIEILFGMGMLLVELTYLIYKIKLEAQVRESIENIKNNIEMPKIPTIDERGKSGLNVLVTLLIIGLLTGFNAIIIATFIIVFIFTINNIYSNIK